MFNFQSVSSKYLSDAISFHVATKAGSDEERSAKSQWLEGSEYINALSLSSADILRHKLWVMPPLRYLFTRYQKGETYLEIDR